MNSELQGRLLGGLIFVFGVLLIGAGCYGVWWLNTISSVGYLLLGICVTYNGWERMMPTRYAPIYLEANEPDMLEAVALARAEIERFRDGVKYTQKEAKARFALETGDGYSEHVWAVVHRINGNTLQVSLPSEPGKKVSPADPRAEMPLHDLEDWMLIDKNGQTEGGYTLGAMAKKYLFYKGYIPRGLRLQLDKFVDVDLERYKN